MFFAEGYLSVTGSAQSIFICCQSLVKIFGMRHSYFVSVCMNIDFWVLSWESQYDHSLHLKTHKVHFPNTCSVSDLKSYKRHEELELIE